MAIITLTTDFGTTDEYVGVMKGVIAGVDPGAIVVDICHAVSPQNIEQAALMLEAAYRYFPKGTIHVVVVDPGVGHTRAVVAFERAGYFFVGPDNGVFTPLFDGKSAGEIVWVQNEAYFLKPLSRTFHGRDIFAPVAAHISLGVPLTDLGPLIEVEDLVRLNRSEPFINQSGELVGRVVTVDRFGNLITDIDQKLFAAFCQTAAEKSPQVRIGDARKIVDVVETYQTVALKEPLAIFGSRGYLEVAVNQGSARIHFDANIGDGVVIVAGAAEKQKNLSG